MTSQPDWGRLNLESPPTADQAPFADPTLRKKHWLMEPPDAESHHHLRAFWDDLSKDIDSFVQVVVLDPNDAPKFASALPLLSSDANPFLGISRHQRSPNWSGTMVRATGAKQLTQVVGRWQEPLATASGVAKADEEYRSSIWVGFNGHAAHFDAALPQVGTCQQLEQTSSGGPWTKEVHWIWFQWWAQGKATDDIDLRIPKYINFPFEAGDTIWCSLELMRGDRAQGDPDAVARVCICHLSHRTQLKTLILPFIMYPPRVPNTTERVGVCGTTANWVIELPRKSRDVRHPFLMPALGPQSHPTVTIDHCVASVAPEFGAPAEQELTLEVSRRIHLVGVVTDINDGETLRLLSSVDPYDAQADTVSFTATVPGNGA